MTLADISEKTKVAWPVLVALLGLTAMAVGVAARGETTSDRVTKLESETQRAKAQRDSDYEGLNELKRQVTGMDVKLDMLLQRGGIRQVHGVTP